MTTFLNVTAARRLIRQYAADHHGGDLNALRGDLNGLSSFLNEQAEGQTPIEGTYTPGLIPQVGRALLMNSVPEQGGFEEVYPPGGAFLVSPGAPPITRSITEDLLRDTFEGGADRLGPGETPEIVLLPETQPFYERLASSSSTINSPGTDEQVRFSAPERGELLDLARTASLPEVEKVKKFIAGTLTAKGMFGEPIPWPIKANEVFAIADEPFRVELQAVVEARGAELLGGAEVPEPSPRVELLREVAGPRRFAVLMIDAQHTHPFPGEDVAAEKDAMKAVLDRAEAKSVPVFEVVWPGQFETDSDLAAHRNPKNWTRVEKRGISAFGGTNLLEELRRLGVTDVVLMGLYQEQCVQMTAHDAAMRGLRVHTSQEILQSALGQPNFVGWKAIPTANVVPSYRHLPIFEDDAASPVGETLHPMPRRANPRDQAGQVHGY